MKGKAAHQYLILQYFNIPKTKVKKHVYESG